MVSIKSMSIYAVAMVALSAVSLVGIAVVTQFKTGTVLFNQPTGCTGANATMSWCVMETNADYIVTGLAIFGSFSAVVAIALVGKIVIGLFKQ